MSGRRPARSGAHAPLTARAARRRAVRRRRLVAIAAVVGVAAVLSTAMVLGYRSRDAFAGTWKGVGAGSLVICHVSGDDYTVKIGGAHKVRPARRSGDRLIVAAAVGTTGGTLGATTAGTSPSATSSATSSASSSATPSATLGASADLPPGSSSRILVLMPGPSRGTLEECFADGTSAVLTRH